MLKKSLIGFVIVMAGVIVAKADEDPLKDLGERYLTQEKRANEAREKAKTDQEHKEVFEKLDPRNIFVDDFLRIEKEHRGTPAAISALYQLIRHATSVGNPDIPASQGRVKAIKILRDHYLEHPDLNLLLGHFNSGAFVPEAEGLLRDAAKSPHPQIRAAARFQLARFLEHKAQLAEVFGAEPLPDETITVPAALVEIRRKLREQVTKLAIDPATERKEALSLIEQLIAEYPDVVQSFVKQEGPGNLSISRASAEKLGVNPRTYAKLSESLRFELLHLQKGQVAPDISGKDADGIEFKLSDYRGRVVLLMFSANWCGPCKAMYPDLRKLQAELEKEPFAALAVMGDQRVDSVIEDTKRGEIRWRTWFDSNQGPIATTWNINSWPTLFLLDHNGLIIDRQPGRSYEALKKSIDLLLVAQKADPNSEEQIKTHPVPEFRVSDQVNLGPPNARLAKVLRQEAREADEKAALKKAAITAPSQKPNRRRPETSSGRLLDKLEEQNAGSERFHDPWLRTLKAIVELGPDAVPDLVAELDATIDNMMLRCCGFTLRAIGDKRAVPALIRAIPKTLLPPGSDMGLRSDDAELAKWAQLHELNGGRNGGVGYGFGRPVREIFGALNTLTGQKMDEQEIYNMFLDGVESQRQMKRELYYRKAKQWSDWWDQHAGEYTTDATYTQVNLLPFPAEAAKVPLAGAHYKTGGGNSNWVLESVLDHKAGRTFYDLDTGRAAGLPDKWRESTSIEPLLDEILAWAAREGFDLMCTEYAAPDGQRYYALRAISLLAWELDPKRWKMKSDDLTVEELQAEGTPTDGLLLHFDKTKQLLDPAGTASFLFITRQGTPGLLFIGIEVKDDSLQPGGASQGDNELNPVAFKKGRRFAYTEFEETK